MKLIIADDHRIFRQGLKSLLEDEPGINILAEASSGHELMSLIRHREPDIILLDVEMPGMDGLESMQQIKKLRHSCKVIVLTMHSETSYIKRMVQSGAAGYVLKDAGKTELIKAIQAIQNGETYFSPEVSEAVMKKLTAKEKPALTKREIEIVKLIADQMTTAEIADKLSLSPHTIEAHRKNIFLKLGLKNSAGLVRYAIEKGLVD